jgi:peroxiredoxin
LEGRIYNHETTNGKIVVLKFWFIGCAPCVKEMPALNKLVNQYKNREDIVFVSLAFDKKEDLKKFLANKTFNYAVVPDEKDYLIKDLEVVSFPTHVVINKKGVVVKVVDSYEEMEAILLKEASK